MRHNTLEQYPKIKPILEKLSAELDKDTMTALNANVALHGRNLEEVATEFLRQRALFREP